MKNVFFIFFEYKYLIYIKKICIKILYIIKKIKLINKKNL